jgi:23S rRNA pseudouridine1911/1915/1917 synthase
MTEVTQIVVPEALHGQRLDRALAALFPEYSRAQLQRWIKADRVQVDGRSARQRDPVSSGETLSLRADAGSAPDRQAWDAPGNEPAMLARPVEIPVPVLHVDDDVIVVDKPAGLVVHPGSGHQDDTLANHLLYHYPKLAELPRYGIVHRLDRDTTGVMVVAHSHLAHKSLTAAIGSREAKREYTAVVVGLPTAGGTVDEPIGRHPRIRTRMAVTPSGREALTRFTVKERFVAHSVLSVFLETGRTHQIRVHLAHRGYPIIGDRVYGTRPRFPKGADETLIGMLGGFPRQALHARCLSFTHPRSGEELSISADLPTDYALLVKALRSNAAGRG